MENFSGSIWVERPSDKKGQFFQEEFEEKKPLLTSTEVSNIIVKLKNQNSYAPYEKKLLDTCYEWLKNYNRR